MPRTSTRQRLRLSLLLLLPTWSIAGSAEAASMYLGVDAAGVITITDSPTTLEGFQQVGTIPPAQAPSTLRVPTHPRVDAYDDLIIQAARRHGISPALLKAVCLAESGMNPHAVSRVGARGLMQLMPATARGLGVRDPFDPASSLDGGARYLARLLDDFGDLRLALAAYNAGPARVRSSGIPRSGETPRFVDRVIGYYGWFLDHPPGSSQVANAP